MNLFRVLACLRQDPRFEYLTCVNYNSNGAVADVSWVGGFRL